VLFGLTQAQSIPGHYIEKANVQAVYFSNKVKRQETDIAMAVINDPNFLDHVDEFIKIIPEHSLDVVLFPTNDTETVHIIEHGVQILSIPKNLAIPFSFELYFKRVKGNKLLLLGNES
jgi:hypothetical protein